MAYIEKITKKRLETMSEKETEKIIVSYHDKEEVYLITLKELCEKSSKESNGQCKDTPLDIILNLMHDYDPENVEIAEIKEGKFQKLALFSS